MNSTSLQQEFPEVYREFFWKNDLVVSGCFSMSWGPRGVGNLANQIIAKSRIPLKCYVGIRKRKDNKIVFWDYTEYNSASCEFTRWNLPFLLEKWQIIEEICHTHTIRGGYDISILSEIWKGHSVWFSGTLFAIMALVIKLLSEQLTTENLDDYKEFLTSSTFEEVFRLGWLLEWKFKNGNSIGQTVMTTLQNNSDPTVYIIPNNSDISEQNISDIPYQYIPLSSNLNSTVTGKIPLDYYVIFSWISANTPQIEQFKVSDRATFESAQNSVVDLLKDKADWIPSNSIFSTISNSPFVWFDTLLSQLNAITLLKFKDILSFGYSSNTIVNFIIHLNHLRAISGIIEQIDPFAEELNHAFFNEKIREDEMIGIFPWYSAKLWGWYVIALKPEISRNTLLLAIEKMKKKFPNIVIEYCSHKDGESSCGITVEQHVSQNLFSKYIPKNSVLFQDTDGHSSIATYQEMKESEWKTGLIADFIEWKLYLDGQWFNSKELPSQSTTMDLLQKILEHNDSVSNKELPSSSYTKSKNEMLWKIILPLINVVKNRTGEEIIIECKWGISEYQINFISSSIRIGFIKKI